MRTREDKLISWLSVLQGFSMLLVVLGHVTLTNVFRDESVPLVALMEGVIYSFHMPLFMFTSGWLFFYTCIKRNSSYSDVLARKVKRIVVPFLFFTVATMFIKIGFSSWVNRPVDSREIVNTFLLFSSNPLGEMWFLTVLFELMLLYPFYKICDRGNRLVGLFIISIVLSVIVPDGIDLYRISLFFEMAPYFIAGIMVSRYSIIEQLAHKKIVIVTACVAFSLINVFNPFELSVVPLIAKRILQAFSGICMSVCFCVLLSDFFPGAFKSFRAYTFQIFLLGIFFQMLCRHLYAQCPDWTYALFFVASVTGALYFPVILSKIISKKIPRLAILFGL